MSDKINPKLEEDIELEEWLNSEPEGEGDGSSWPVIAAMYASPINTFDLGSFHEQRDSIIRGMKKYLRVTDEESYDADVAYQTERNELGLSTTDPVVYPWPDISEDRVKMKIVKADGAVPKVIFFVGMNS